METGEVETGERYTTTHTRRNITKFYRGFHTRENPSKPKSTQYTGKWSVEVFRTWQAAREQKFCILEAGSVFKDHDVHRVETLEEKLQDLDSLSLNYRLTKFVQEVANKNSGRYPSRSLYGTVCGLKRYLEDVNGGNALNPLDSSDKR